MSFTARQECPICLEVMDDTDLALLPCPCDYQVCLWCLQRIRQQENNKCPQCRREYDDAMYRRVPIANILRRGTDDSESIASSQPVPDLQGHKASRIIDTRRASGQRGEVDVDAQQTSETQRFSGKHPTICRLYNCPATFLNAQALSQLRFLGKYGRLLSIVICNSRHPDKATAFITFTREEDATIAYQDICKFATRCLDPTLKNLRFQIGAARHCIQSLRGMPCTNEGCPFIHGIIDKHPRYFWKTQKKGPNWIRTVLPEKILADIVHDPMKDSMFMLTLPEIQKLSYGIFISALAVETEKREWAQISMSDRSLCKQPEAPSVMPAGDSGGSDEETGNTEDAPRTRRTWQRVSLVMGPERRAVSRKNEAEYADDPAFPVISRGPGGSTRTVESADLSKTKKPRETSSSASTQPGDMGGDTSSSSSISVGLSIIPPPPSFASPPAEDWQPAPTTTAAPGSPPLIGMKVFLPPPSVSKAACVDSKERPTKQSTRSRLKSEVCKEAIFREGEIVTSSSAAKEDSQGPLDVMCNKEMEVPLIPRDLHPITASASPQELAQTASLLKTQEQSSFPGACRPAPGEDFHLDNIFESEAISWNQTCWFATQDNGVRPEGGVNSLGVPAAQESHSRPQALGEQQADFRRQHDDDRYMNAWLNSLLGQLHNTRSTPAAVAQPKYYETIPPGRVMDAKALNHAGAAEVLREESNKALWSTAVQPQDAAKRYDHYLSTAAMNHKMFQESTRHEYNPSIQHISRRPIDSYAPVPERDDPRVRLPFTTYASLTYDASSPGQNPRIPLDYCDSTTAGHHPVSGMEGTGGRCLSENAGVAFLRSVIPNATINITPSAGTANSSTAPFSNGASDSRTLLRRNRLDRDQNAFYRRDYS